MQTTCVYAHTYPEYFADERRGAQASADRAAGRTRRGARALGSLARAVDACKVDDMRIHVKT